MDRKMSDDRKILQLPDTNKLVKSQWRAVIMNSLSICHIQPLVTLTF